MRARQIAALVVVGTALLTGCSEGTPSVDPSATILPTPTRSAEVPGDLLRGPVQELVGARAVVVDEDLQYGPRQREVRLTWGARGSVVHASVLPVSLADRAGNEVFRSPTVLLQRTVGNTDACWSPGTAAAARFDQPVVHELAVLRSARATSSTQGLLVGSLSARPLLGLLGSDEQLRGQGLDPSTTARVPATFATDGDALTINTGWGSLAEAAGAKRAGGTLSLRYRALDAGGPAAPTADMMCP